MVRFTKQRPAPEPFAYPRDEHDRPLCHHGRPIACLECAGEDEADASKAPEPSTADCIGHRCDEHEDVPPVNDSGPHGSECGICVAERLVEAYEKAFEEKVFWPIVTSARDRLNILAPGAGDKFVDEARATLNTASIDDGEEEANERLPTNG